MTPINHYEGDRPKDFYNDGLFIRFAMTLDELPGEIRHLLQVDTIPEGQAVCFTRVDRYIAKCNIHVEFARHEEGMREYCYKVIRRELIETIGNTILNELLKS